MSYVFNANVIDEIVTHFIKPKETIYIYEGGKEYEKIKRYLEKSCNIIMFDDDSFANENIKEGYYIISRNNTTIDKLLWGEKGTRRFLDC